VEEQSLQSHTSRSPGSPRNETDVDSLPVQMLKQAKILMPDKSAYTSKDNSVD